MNKAVRDLVAQAIEQCRNHHHVMAEKGKPIGGNKFKFQCVDCKNTFTLDISDPKRLTAQGSVLNTECTGRTESGLSLEDEKFIRDHTDVI